MKNGFPFFLLAAGAVAAFGAGALVDGFGWRADFLEKICSAPFTLSGEKGVWGRQVQGKLEKSRLYQKLDPLFGGVVTLMTDGNGNLDPRPLGTRTVIECAYGNVVPGEYESGMCEFVEGRLRPLKKGDSKARARVIQKLAFRGGPTAPNGFEWQVSREFRLKRRDDRAILPLDVNKLRNLGRQVIVPGRTVPKFYRTDAQYWRVVAGENFALPKGFWMQPFHDGNFHQVRLGFHLEEWPGEPNIMVEVSDQEAWIKVGRGESAYYLLERVKKGIDWGTYYTDGVMRPVNMKISAANACRACTGAGAGAETAFEDLETLPLEPELPE